jgi:hypothetical protein
LGPPSIGIEDSVNMRNIRNIGGKYVFRFFIRKVISEGAKDDRGWSSYLSKSLSGIPRKGDIKDSFLKYVTEGKKVKPDMAETSLWN